MQFCDYSERLFRSNPYNECEIVVEVYECTSEVYSSVKMKIGNFAEGAFFWKIKMKNIFNVDPQIQLWGLIAPRDFFQVILLKLIYHRQGLKQMHGGSNQLCIFTSSII